jgi:hypothetical protein
MARPEDGRTNRRPLRRIGPNCSYKNRIEDYTILGDRPHWFAFGTSMLVVCDSEMGINR